ncbi:50S ribosomal protein L32 [candidate division KSB1 bacterium]|nr:MAG: 50S ribosomal protein L32 [candidate division KSB1 bacterium]
MGALPKRKISKQRKNQRRAHHALTEPTLTVCKECGSKRLTHNVCPKCGTFKGVKVLKVS